MFTTLIVQPIFNILTFIYALIPGHNFGIAIILFTLVVRIIMYPLLKKQLRHTKAIRELQPEIKKIKESTKGNRQQEQLLTMELYKEREIKPLSFIGLMVVQLVIFLALFQGLSRVVNDPYEVFNFSYPVIQNMPAMQELNADISIFDNTLLGVVDLSRAAISTENGFYLAAFLLVLGSSIIQFFQIKQTMPSDKQARKLREILKDANSGKQADTAEVNAAMSRNMSYVLPVFIFVVTVGFPAALSLYWFVSGLIAYLQQSYLLKQDEYALTGPSAEVVSKKPLSTKGGVKITRLTEKDLKEENAQKTTPPSKKTSKSKRRKKK
jgi:YidC/Oxa1 family membrane protein insertase